MMLIYIANLDQSKEAAVVCSTAITHVCCHQMFGTAIQYDYCLLISDGPFNDAVSPMLTIAS